MNSLICAAAAMTLAVNAFAGIHTETVQYTHEEPVVTFHSTNPALIHPSRAIIALCTRSYLVILRPGT